jgi:hypothetical protein
VDGSDTVDLQRDLSQVLFMIQRQSSVKTHLVGADNGKIGHTDHLVLTLALKNGELGDDIMVVTIHLTDLHSKSCQLEKSGDEGEKGSN